MEFDKIFRLNGKGQVLFYKDSEGEWGKETYQIKHNLTKSKENITNIN